MGVKRLQGSAQPVYIVSDESGNTVIGDIDVISSVLPTGASTAAAQAALLAELQAKADLTETQPVSGHGESITQTPTVTAGAYSAGDAVGGLLTFANAALVSTGGGIIKQVLIIDDAGQDAEMELWLFNATFTAMADNAPWAPSQADLRKLVGIVTTVDGSWFAAGTPSVARILDVGRYDLAGTSLFGQLVARGTPTFAATDDVSVIIGILQD